MEALKPEDVSAAKELCRQVVQAINALEKSPTCNRFEPGPAAAHLKRKSMELTRALARLRGRGRF